MKSQKMNYFRMNHTEMNQPINPSRTTVMHIQALKHSMLLENEIEILLAIIFGRPSCTKLDLSNFQNRLKLILITLEPNYFD